MRNRIIALDAMGGDNAPVETVKGASEAVRERDDLKVLLFGRAGDIAPLADKYTFPEGGMEIRDCSDIITMEDQPTMAVRRKTDSSMVRAMMSLKEGECEAMVSAGSTGALLAGGILRVGRIKGIDRPAMNAIMPGSRKNYLLIDVGANVDCQPRYLLQFALMGSIYMEKVVGIKDPDVRLVNIGVEEEKGNERTKEAYKLMKEQRVFNFGGNIEARDVAEGFCDVAVADGFDGNIILKFAEGLAKAIGAMLKQQIMKDTRSKLGGLLLKPALSDFKKTLSADEYGGAPLLGVSKVMIKAHGNATSTTIKNAIYQALRTVDADVVHHIESGIARLDEYAQEANN